MLSLQENGQVVPPFHLSSIPFSMHGGRGGPLTFNPDGQRTQVDWEPLGKTEL